MNSSLFVPASKHWRSPGYAPDRIFNDDSILASLAFLPDSHRLLLQIQDDLLLAKPVSICEFFTTSPSFGMRVFATPYEGEIFKNPYDSVYKSAHRFSADQWARMERSTTKGRQQPNPHPYYHDMHLPQLLDTRILKDLWHRFPADLSAVVDTSFRYPNLTNVISLHHSEVARHSRVAREAAKPHARQNETGTPIAESDLASSSRVVSMMFDTNIDVLPFHDRPWTEVTFESVDSWHEHMAHIPPVPEALPPFLSLQDNLGNDDNKTRLAELDCLREQWLGKLFPGPSSFEDPGQPPRKCDILLSVLAALELNETTTAGTNETCAAKGATGTCAEAA